jgi:hypothetical protein
LHSAISKQILCHTAAEDESSSSSSSPTSS